MTEPETRTIGEREYVVGIGGVMAVNDGEPEPFYPTKMVSAATGATARQLQCWDETKVLSVRVVKHERRYRFRDVLYAGLLMILVSTKHLTLKRSAQALSQLKGEYDLMRCVDRRDILLIGYGSNDVELICGAGVLDALLESNEPILAVDLYVVSMRLAEALG